MTTYEILDSFGLNDPSKIADRLSEWGDEEFQRFFDAYSEKAKNRPLVSPAGNGSTDVFPDSAAGPIPLELIRQLCVYVSRFYIHDPILLLEDDFLTLDTHFERVIQWKNREERLSQFRAEAEQEITKLIAL